MTHTGPIHSFSGNLEFDLEHSVAFSLSLGDWACNSGDTEKADPKRENERRKKHIRQIETEIKMKREVLSRYKCEPS